MDEVQGGDSMAPALGRRETTPADGDRSNFDTGNPIFSGGQINGGVSSEADLRRRSSIPTAAHIPDATTDPKVENPQRIYIMCLVHGARLSCAMYMACDGTILHGDMITRHLQLCHIQMC
ncbi:hypothetical protein ACQJBY_029573 [Aegilops geniculata]